MHPYKWVRSSSNRAPITDRNNKPDNNSPNSSNSKNSKTICLILMRLISPRRLILARWHNHRIQIRLQAVFNNNQTISSILGV